jgi:deoxycytidylate deaminase
MKLNTQSMKNNVLNVVVAESVNDLSAVHQVLFLKDLGGLLTVIVRQKRRLMINAHFNRFFHYAFDVIQARDKGRLEYSLAAVLVSGGRVLSIGTNQQRSCELVQAFRKNSWNNLHAECAAILKVRRKIDLTGSKIYVARITPSNKISCAAPCEMCLDVIRAYGIKRVIYTIDENTIGSITP